jgi:hypothetical protein
MLTFKTHDPSHEAITNHVKGEKNNEEISQLKKW